MTEKRVKCKLSAILSADVVSYSRPVGDILCVSNGP